jgi:aminopeptidase N
MRKKQLLYFAFCWVLVSALIVPVIKISAQTLPLFTRQDSLRGSLRPERTCFDVTFYNLAVRVNIAEKSIKGSNAIRYKVVQDFQKIQLDLFANMEIEKVVFNNKTLKYKREGNAFFVDFPSVQKKGSSGEITVFYSGKPLVARMPPWDGGFVWKKDKTGKDWVGVACENVGASLWWPNKDHYSEEPDSMKISCEVPTGLTCVANGNLLKTTELKDDFTRFDWLVSYPINNYNVTLNIADYTHFTDEFTSTVDGQKLQLDYYVLPYNLEKAKKQFQQVKPMLACYEKFLGKYPFWKDGYCLVETSYLGMEHQGAIAYGNQYLNGYLGQGTSSYPMQKQFDYIIIHETGHEWWGNSVSMKDAADMWIHESFCTYTESFYVECQYGKEAAQSFLQAYMSEIKNDRPIIGIYGVNYEGSSDMYPKGAVMLHTLRNVLDNDKLWFSIVKGILEDFKLKTVTTDEIVAYINKKSGKDLTSFFSQYLRQTNPPTFVYSLAAKNGKTELTYRWKADVKDFKMPLKVGFDKNKYQTITPSLQEQKVLLDGKPEEFKIARELFYILAEKL